MGDTTDLSLWGAYPNYDDMARLEYGRLLWRNPRLRARLLAHWTSPDHPGAQRFGERRALVEHVLSFTGSDAALDTDLRASGHSLRAVVREIPPVFGSI
jgi:hypothetical protein